MVNGKLTQGLGVSSSPAERERTGNRLSRERWGKAATDLKILLGSPHLPVAFRNGSLLLPLKEREKTQSPQAKRPPGGRPFLVNKCVTYALTRISSPIAGAFSRST